MMRFTPARCRTQVQNTLDALLNSQLAVDCQPAVITTYTGGFRRVSWPRYPIFSSKQPFSADFFTIESFYNWLINRQYSAVLFDGSLLQLTFDFQNTELTGQRLAYIPCPFNLDELGVEMLRSEPILDVIDFYRCHGEEYLRLRTPLRFDFHPSAASVDHPAVHLTLNEQGCRIPVCAPLTLGQFIELVFRYFYPTTWSENDFLCDIDPMRLPRDILYVHEQSLHLNWRTYTA
jgi:hypothetical protein